MTDKEINKDLLDLLKVSEGANKAFDHLIDCIETAMEKCNMAMFDMLLKDGGGIGVLKAVNALQIMIVSSGHDERIIRIARSILSASNISSHEIKITSEGEVKRRQIYFVQRADGAVKIGSSMDAKTRIKGIEAHAGKLTTLKIIDGTTQLEKSLHCQFEHDKIHNEWFKSENILEFIASL